MALAHSPKIATDGLVFAYDMGNTQKSWKGAPTTNLVDTSMYIYNNVPGDVSAALVNTGEFYRGAAVWKLTLTPITATGVSYLTGGSNPGIGVVSGGGGGLANRYTGHAIFYKPTVPMHSTPLFTNYSNIGGWGAGPLGSNRSVSMGDGWSRGEVIWFDTVSRSDGKYWAINPATATLNVPIVTYWAGPFKEDRNDSNHVAAYAVGTRSTAQAVIDLTSRRTVTVAGSPTYGSDGTFTFNSAGSTTLNLGSGSNFLPMPSLTFESWIKTPGLGSGMTVNGIWGFTYGIRFNADSNGNLYFIIGTDTTTFVNIGTSGVNVNDNSWHHIVAVKNGDTSCTIYLNGVARASGVPTAGWSGTNPWVAMDVQVGRDLNDAPYYFNGKIDIGRVYNRGLTAAEVQQNFNAIKMKYYGENPEVPATSGVNLKLVRPNLPSGFYWIKTNSMPNALRMYVDMSEEGGGYDFYPMQGTGISIGSTNGTHSGIALGLDLVYPRSKQHWTAMSNFVRNVLGSTGNEYFTTAYSVYRETSGGAGSRGGNYTGDIMRNPAFYGTGTPDWRVPDGGRWWLRDTTFGEPNGDYTAYNFLGGYSLPNPYTGQDIGFNDVTGQTYTTGTYYLLSTNTKP